MSSPTGITVNGTTYDVFTEYDSLQRSFEIKEGSNTGTSISGLAIRDIIGTAYKYSLTVRCNPDNPTDYDSFFEAISAPTNYVTITFPYGQTTKTIKAKVTSGEDTYKGKVSGSNIWDEFTFEFEEIQPTRTS